MQTAANSQVAVCLALTRAISRTTTVGEIYAAALDALAEGLGVSRSAILLFDPDGVMRFKASRGLSSVYRATVEGHTPWRPDTPDPEPIVVRDVGQEPSLQSFLPVIQAEDIAAMAFLPLVSQARVIGKFMLYYSKPHALSAEDLELGNLIAAQVAFAVARTRAEEQARSSGERLRFALEAASMGTWDWDLSTQAVRWSDNLERIHGMAPGTFDGTFSSYEQEIHPDDRVAVLASAQRAIETGVPHEVEYRMVGPDGTIRWVEGKGRVEYEDGQPVRMTGVCMMVTRRKEAELARLTAAEEASRLKDEFLATLSHELRTPLNAILGWVQILLAGGLSPERISQAMDVIGRNAKLQARLIEDILDVSRIITGKMEVERRQLLVQQVLDTAMTGILPAAATKQITVVRDIAADQPPIEGDPKRLHQVMGNVLSNAIKFTPEGGRVEVRCAPDGDTLRIEVHDSGIGIAPEFAPFVFDRFRQADSRSTRQHGGLGLGLAIARHLLELHGGTIRAHSAGAGHGTTVEVHLPLGSTAGQIVPPEPSVVDDQPADLRLEGTTVLVVDDQLDSRDLLATLFQRRGAEVLQCSSAVAALETMNARLVHLLVADLAMPDVDGFELIERVRRTRHLPAIAVSAYARPEDRSKAFAAGYSGYCAKPLDAAGFLSVVGRVLRDATVSAYH